MPKKPTYKQLLQKVETLEKEKCAWLKESEIAAGEAGFGEKGGDRLDDSSAEVDSLGVLIDVAAIQSIMDDFYSLTGMVTAILDMDGSVIESTGWQDICTKFHRIHPKTAQNCIESDLFLTKKLKAGEHIKYQCKNGLWDVVTPLYIGNKHLGNIYTGQFFYDDDFIDEQKFIQQAETYGFEKDAYLDAFHKIPRYRKKIIDQLMSFLVKFTTYISNVSYANLKLEKEIKERQELQARLAQVQKMDSIGRLAGGVAHDFNNKLLLILGYVELIMSQSGPGSQNYDELVEIQKAAQHSAEITRQLLAFARKQTIAPQVLDLNSTVESMLKMLRRLIGENIGLSWLPGTDLGLVRLDPAQIDQILTNLCVNARDAIQGTGKINIATASATFDEADCAPRTDYIPGDYITLTVSDNGSGMDQQTIANIFEPFFTTKEFGKGTGLGLATVYGIVKQNRGVITVSSEIDQGTTFKIYLPKHQIKMDSSFHDAEGHLRRP